MQSNDRSNTMILLPDPCPLLPTHLLLSADLFQIDDDLHSGSHISGFPVFLCLGDAFDAKDRIDGKAEEREGTSFALLCNRRSADDACKFRHVKNTV